MTTVHDMQPIPDVDEYRRMCYCGTELTHACTRCGIWNSSLNYGASTDCDEILRSGMNKPYFPGEPRYPFRQTNGGAVSSSTCVTGIPAGGGMSQGAAGGSGSITGVSAGGMPVRGGFVYMGGGGGCSSGDAIYGMDPGHSHGGAVTGRVPAAAPKEDIPGITPETIDKDAYDSFMKGL